MIRSAFKFHSSRWVCRDMCADMNRLCRILLLQSSRSRNLTVALWQYQPLLQNISLICSLFQFWNTYWLLQTSKYTSITFLRFRCITTWQKIRITTYRKFQTTLIRKIDTILLRRKNCVSLDSPNYWGRRKWKMLDYGLVFPYLENLDIGNAIWKLHFRFRGTCCAPMSFLQKIGVRDVKILRCENADATFK